jgi:hypothetical protein
MSRANVAAVVFLGVALSIIGCGGESADGRNGFRVEGTEAGDCEDNADNDADGLFDCDDPGCAGSSVCVAEVDGGTSGIGGNAGTGGVGGMGGDAGAGGMSGMGGQGGMAGMAGMGGMAGQGGTAGSAGGAGAGGSVGAGGTGGGVLCAGVDCEDGNECTVDTCDPVDGACVHTDVTDGTTCDFGGFPGVCAAGVCEDAMLCSDAVTRCDDSNPCTTDTCDPTFGDCSNDPANEGGTCDFGGLPGVCTAGVCEDAMLCADAATRCDDANLCTADSCDPMDGQCGYTNVTDGTSCDLGGLPGVCRAGACDCAVIMCPDGRSYGCGDCLDNDGDGLADDQDPECLGPCDNTEGPILLSGGPGETGNQCGADCYFDMGNGSGSSDCHWDRGCDPLEPKDQCPYDPTFVGNLNYCPDVQPAACEDGCAAITPNGCDCFGCCTFPELEGMAPDGGDGYVFLGSVSDAAGTCTLATVTDPDLCRPCTPAGNCLNTCERCEICLGKPDIPEDCFPGTGGSGGSGGMGGSGGGERCPDGKQVCGLPGDDPCPGGSFCLTGCCTIVVQ